MLRHWPQLLFSWCYLLVPFFFLKGSLVPATQSSTATTTSDTWRVTEFVDQWLTGLEFLNARNTRLKLFCQVRKFYLFLLNMTNNCTRNWIVEKNRKKRLLLRTTKNDPDNEMLMSLILFSTKIRGPIRLSRILYFVLAIRRQVWNRKDLFPFNNLFI